jgi:hypothetical protein
MEDSIWTCKNAKAGSVSKFWRAYLFSEDGGEKMHRGIRAKYPNAGQGSSHHALLSHLKNITVNFFLWLFGKHKKI